MSITQPPHPSHPPPLQQPSVCFLRLRIPHISEVIWYMSFSDWLISLSILTWQGRYHDHVPVLYYNWRRTPLSISGILHFALMFYYMMVWVAYLWGSLDEVFRFCWYSHKKTIKQRWRAKNILLHVIIFTCLFKFFTEKSSDGLSILAPQNIPVESSSCTDPPCVSALWWLHRWLPARN